MPGKQRAQVPRTAGQHDGHAVVPGCGDRSGDDLGGCVIAAHGIHSDGSGARAFAQHAVSLSSLAPRGITGTASNLLLCG
jgi:hypothetical protein